jgi:7-cyano-7-deazaguanine synthase
MPICSIATSWAEGSAPQRSSSERSRKTAQATLTAGGFHQAFNQAIMMGTKPETRITIETPLIHLKKSQIVKKGVDLGAPLDLTWSCYQNSEKACGRCESCALRLKGFIEAGVKDPIRYETK